MDNKIKDFFTKKRNLIITYLIIISVIALYARIKMLGFESWDYINCIQAWIDTIIKKGNIKALKYSIGNYNIIYMTFLALISYLPFKHILMVKGFSIIFDFVCAIFGSLIIGELSKDKKNKLLYQSIVYTVILFVPTVLMNSALWGQCDSIYTAFTIISIYLLLKDKMTLSFIFAGISFAFKLQFIFILPLYILLYFKKKNISLLHFLIIPLVNFITCLPAIIAGRSVKDCLMIYFEQTGQQNIVLTNNFPNIYKFINVFFGDNQGTVGILFTVALIGIIVLILLYKQTKLAKENILELGLIFIIIMTQFLPFMHERYAFAAEVLLCIYVILNKGKHWLYLVVAQLAISSEYLSFMSSINQEYVDYLSIIYVIYSMYFIFDILKNILTTENVKKKEEVK